MRVSLIAILAATAFAQPPDYAHVADDAESILGELIAIDTTNPPGNETAAARAMEKRFRTAGIDATVVESAPGRGNVIARLRGDGSRKPLLLIAHLDVVGAGPLWSTDPFKLVDQEGYWYGRGVSDDKGAAAIAVATLIDLKRRNVPLSRDVIVALTADEESGGDAGVVWLLKNRKELIDAEFALNEGARARIEGGKLQYVGFEAEQKIYRTYFLDVEGPGGHSSVPLPDNAIYRLAAALGRIEKLQFPARLTETTRAYFAGLAPLTSGPLAADMRAVAAAKGALPPGPVERLSAVPVHNAVLRTTCVATMLEAGHRENALPQKARATVNCRALPGEPDVLATLQRTVADERVKVTADRPIGEAPAAKLEGPVLDAARKVASAMSPGVPVLPTLSTGATDSRHLRLAGVAAYGLQPFPSDDDDARRAHGRDERLLKTSLRYGAEFLARTTAELAGK